MLELKDRAKLKRLGDLFTLPNPDKPETRISKSETNSNKQNSNDFCAKLNW
jgi:hypothetical protein